MANSSLACEIYSSTATSGAGGSKSLDEIESALASKRKRPILAPKFKYQTNFPQRDLNEIRKILTIERSKLQNKEQLEFLSLDYERLMRDDWLVTRFLLRGMKASGKEQTNANSEIKIATQYDKREINAPTDMVMIAKTMDLIRSCGEFRLAYNIHALTREDEFPTEWIETNGLFNHKPDLAGNPTIYLRIKLHKPKLIESKELRYQFKRLLLFTLEKCDQELEDQPGKGICCIFDMSCATLENVDLELMSWMVKSFKGCGPKLVCSIIIYNLPWFFSATFKLIANTLVSNSNKQYLKFVYGSEILSYIGEKNLPDYLRIKETF